MKTQLLAGTCLVIFTAATAAAGTRVRDAGIRGRHARLASSVSADLPTSSAPDHTCVVLDDGTVRCWGANGSGQLGDGTTVAVRSLPVQVSGLVAITSVAVGRDFSCALVGGTGGGGTVRCWGHNNLGQLGNGSVTSSSTAVSVSGLSGVIQIASGQAHTCALLVDGTVRCWGSNSAGQLGNGSFTGSSLTPVAANLGSTPAVAISAGGSHTCAVLVDGSAVCWGSNSSGELGNGAVSTSAAPGPVITGSLHLIGVVDIAASLLHTCALHVNGTVFCWGDNSVGQLGDGDTAQRPTATLVGQVGQAVAIAVGAAHSCAIGVNGTVQCWGGNSRGQLGDGTTTQETLAQTQVAGVANAVEVSGGNFSACILDSTGSVRCWGANDVGQLGIGSTVGPNRTPSTVSGITGSISARSVSGTFSSTCALRGSGGVSCWGIGTAGQLGASEFVNSSSAVNVTPSSNVVNLSAGGNHVCAVGVTGTVSCWGDNTFGQLGTGNQTSQATAVTVAGLSSVIQVAGGSYHTCALTASGTVQCWGRNEFGQLGIGSLTSSLSPLPVPGLNSVVAITAGDFHTCAVRVTGPMECWGSNSSGQLGDGAAESMATAPVAVLGLDNAVVAMAAKSQHTCALLVNGGVKCWGENVEGLLGNSTIQPRSVPDTVISLTDAIGVSTGLAHTCAVRVDGSASCWGANGNLQLGAADTVDHNVPTSVIQSFTTVKGVQITNRLPFVVAIAAEAFGTCALLTSGQVLCWGDNIEGQAGNGTTGANIARPTAVNSFTANVQPIVTLEFNGRVAVVTALMNCEQGGQALLYLTLQQGQANGSGVALTGCEGGLIEVAMIVPSFTSYAFQDGAATAQVEAIVADDGVVTETQHWQRAVTLVTPPSIDATTTSPQ